MYKKNYAINIDSNTIVFNITMLLQLFLKSLFAYNRCSAYLL